MRTKAGLMGCVFVLAVLAPARPAAAQPTHSGDESTPGLVRGSSTYGASGEVSSLAYPGDCGIQVNRPHNSNQGGIHTRVRSFCNTHPVAANTVSGTTYRSRWYGWQRQGESAPRTTYGPAIYTQDHRETVVAPCDYNTFHRYRTEGFGAVVLPIGTYSAAAYEQNDTEIACANVL